MGVMQMGGRGSAYDKLIEALDKIKQEQHENYSGNLKMNIADFYNDEESEIQNSYFINLKKVNVSMRKSTDDIIHRLELSRQQEWAEVLAKEYKNYFGESKNNIQFASQNIKNPRIGGYTAWIENDGLMIRMVLDSKRINQPNFHKQTIKNSINEKWHAPININDANKYTVTHELGHVVERLLFEKLRKNNPHNIKYLDDKLLAIKVRDDVEKILKNKYTKSGEDVIINISDYSTKNSMEWFAETFTNLHLSEKPLPVAKALSEYLNSKEFE